MAKITVTGTADVLKNLLTPADLAAAETNRNPDISGNIKQIAIRNLTDGEDLYVETNGNVATVADGFLVKFEEVLSLPESDLNNVSFISGGASIDVRVAIT